MGMLERHSMPNFDGRVNADAQFVVKMEQGRAVNCSKRASSPPCVAQHHWSISVASGRRTFATVTTSPALL